MNTNRDDATSARTPRRLPKGPLILIALVIATMLWVYWLTRATPRPPPELPPVRELPLPLEGLDPPAQPAMLPADGSN